MGTASSWQWQQSTVVVVMVVGESVPDHIKPRFVFDVVVVNGVVVVVVVVQHLHLKLSSPLAALSSAS